VTAVDLHNALRRSAAWPYLRRVHTSASPAACSIVHAAVAALGPRVLPADVVLKHIYDYEPVLVSPQAITRALPNTSWRELPAAATSRFGRVRAWSRHGGAWKSCHRHVSRTIHGRFVLEGEWDRAITAFQPRLVIEQLFDEGRAPSETDEYRYLAERIENGRLARTRGYRTMEELDEYFAEMIATFAAIRDEGYLSQRELGGDPADEIRVCVDRNGALAIYGGGTHRLTIAQRLEIPLVPVVVKQVHAEWIGARPDDDRAATIRKVERAMGFLTAP
jgi:hypothetical protein